MPFLDYDGSLKIIIMFFSIKIAIIGKIILPITAILMLNYKKFKNLHLK